MMCKRYTYPAMHVQKSHQRKVKVILFVSPSASIFMFFVNGPDTVRDDSVTLLEKDDVDVPGSTWIVSTERAVLNVFFLASEGRS